MRFQKVDTGENFSFHAVFVHVCHFDGIIAEEIQSPFLSIKFLLYT